MINWKPFVTSSNVCGTTNEVHWNPNNMEFRETMWHNVLDSKERLCYFISRIVAPCIELLLQHLHRDMDCRITPNVYQGLFIGLKEEYVTVLSTKNILHQVPPPQLAFIVYSPWSTYLATHTPRTHTPHTQTPQDDNSLLFSINITIAAVVGVFVCKINFWNAKCACTTAFSTNKRILFYKCRRFWDRKCVNLRKK